MSPILVIRLYEHCLYGRLRLADIIGTKTVHLQNKEFQIAGITMHRSSHYCAIILYEDKTYWYDGLIGRLTDMPKDLESWFPSFVVYCMK